MSSKNVEIGVGVFVALGLAALLMLAMKVSNLSAVTGDGGYEIKARFDNIGTLKMRAPVSMAGVRIGRVSRISFDDETYEAVVTLSIKAEYNRLPEDTAASIYTAGLLGEQYVGLEAGGEEHFLEDQDEIRLTQSAMVLEQLIGQFLYNRASAGGG